MKKISVLFMLIFSIIGFESICFAEENLTLNKFKEIVKADGYDMDNVSFPSYFNQLLNNNPIIFYNQDKTKIMCFTGIVKANGQRDYYPNITIGIVNNQYTIGYQSGSIKTYKSPAGSYSFEGYNITDQSSYPNRYRIGCLINLSDYSFTTISSGYNGYQYYYGGVYPYIGYSYSYYQNDYTLDNFKSLAFIKSKLLENMIFYGKPLYYSNNDIFYKFNGVIKEYYSIYKNQYVNTVGQTTYNDTDLKFRYEVPATYKGNEAGFMDVYLQELSPTETLKQTDKLDKEGYLEKLILTSTEKPHVYGTQPVACNVYFNELIKLMEKGKIYRLRFEFFKNVKDDSGELLGNLSDTATSCFFSLNDWKSNEVEIKNIYKAVYTKDPSLLPSDDNTSDDNTSFIIGSIDNVNKNIQDTILGTPNESGERQGGLVGNLLEGLWKGLVALIIPDSETFGKWITNQTDKLSANAGFLTYSKTFWLSMCNLITNSSGDSDCIFVLPEFKVPGFNTVIWQEQNINLTSYFKNNENEVIKGFYTTYIVLVSGISIFYFCQYLWSLWDSIISGTHQITPEQNEDMQISHDFDMNNGMKTTSYTGRDINGQRYRLRYHYNSRKR